MELATKTQDMMSAFAGEREAPAALIPVNTAHAQLEQRPVGAIKCAIERDDAKVLQRLRVFAAAAGEEFYYRFPVKNKDGGQDWIEGPSIKCALAVARAYGNCDVDVRMQDIGESWIFYARFVDFETGFSITRSFQQRKSQKTMKTDTGRALDIVFQIGQSKAIRNVVCNALGMFTDFAFEEARQAIVEKVGRNIDQYRAKVLARLSDLKIEPKRVETVIGRPADKWLAPDVARVIAEIQAINDGMAAADDLYPPTNGAPEKKPERADFAEKKAEPEKPLTEAEEREADRLTRAAMKGEPAAQMAEEDGWEDYIAKMEGEIASAPTPEAATAVDATFHDALGGAVTRGEIGGERAEAVRAAWANIVRTVPAKTPAAQNAQREAALGTKRGK